MNRFVQVFNFVGILALVVLCCIQWQTNRGLNLEARHLEQVRLEQVTKIGEQEKTIKGCTADLEDFRQRLTIAEAAEKEATGKLATVTAACGRAVKERDQIKAALDKWAAAVTERDKALKQAGEQIQKLVAERDGAVVKFNGLANKYNAIVKEVNDGQPKQ